MAKFRKMRRSVRKIYGGFRKKSRKSGSSQNLLMLAGVSAAYGAAEGYIDSAAAPVYNMMPFGSYNETIAKGGVGYYLAKRSSGIGKTIGQVMLISAAAKAGKSFTSGMISGGSTTNNSYGY